MEHELTGRYPIILDGNEAGAVTVSREGLFWRFEARCALQEELLRLSVYGDGIEGYLGVMEPVGNELKLTKKLSRNALSSFPPAISYATRCGEAPLLIHGADEEQPQALALEAAESTVSEEPAADTAAEDADCGCEPAEDDKPPPELSLAEHSSAEPWRHCPCPCSLFSGLGAKAVCASITGALTKSSGSGTVIAVPQEVAQALPYNEILFFTRAESISGKTYLLADIIE